MEGASNLLFFQALFLEAHWDSGACEGFFVGLSSILGVVNVEVLTSYLTDSPLPSHKYRKSQIKSKN